MPMIKMSYLGGDSINAPRKDEPLLSGNNRRLAHKSYALHMISNLESLESFFDQMLTIARSIN